VTILHERKLWLSEAKALAWNSTARGVTNSNQREVLEPTPLCPWQTLQTGVQVPGSEVLRARSCVRWQGSKGWNPTFAAVQGDPAVAGLFPSTLRGSHNVQHWGPQSQAPIESLGGPHLDFWLHTYEEHCEWTFLTVLGAAHTADSGTLWGPSL
jgi:hypothetical protein